MMPDEVIRAFCYFLMSPAYLYFSFVAWNRRQYLVSIGYGALSLFFGLLLARLVLLRSVGAVPSLLYINTGVVVILAIATTWRATLIFVSAVERRIESVALKLFMEDWIDE